MTQARQEFNPSPADHQYQLGELVWSMENLHLAAKRVIANGGSPGIDGQTIQQFEARLEKNLRELRRELMDGTYTPRPGKMVHIPKPGRKEKRLLVIPVVRDRVAQAALYHVLGPIFESDFVEQSYGFRPGRGCLDALRQTISLLEQGHIFVVDADIKSFFDTIPHELLMELVRAKVQDRRVLTLIRAFLKKGIFNSGEVLYRVEEGTPQGAVISPLLANIYLNPLDHLVANAGFEMVRYADDFVILCHSQVDAMRALDLVSNWMSQAGLSLHPDKTDIRNVNQPLGFTFLGYHFQGNLRSPRPENVIRLKGKIEEAVCQYGAVDLNRAVPEINQITRGWLQHFQLCNNPQPFQDIDHWVWQCLTAAQEKSTRRNKPHHHPKPLQRAPHSLARALRKKGRVG